MKILNLSVGAMIWRLHIMAAMVVTLGFLGLLYVGIVLGMLLFLATLMGIQWKHVKTFLHLDRAHSYEWQQKHHHPVHH
jgi:hypothetical protein